MTDNFAGENNSVTEEGVERVLPRRDERAREEVKKSASEKVRRGGLSGESLGYAGGFPVYLSRYVLFGGGRPRAAMRFYNGSDAVLTGVRFKVTEFDGADRIIAEYALERRGLNAEKGAEFSVADAAVRPECARLEVSVISAFSDPYEYVVGGDGATVRYGVGEEERDFYFEKSPSCKIRRRRKALVALSLIVVAAVALIAAAVCWRLGIFDNFLH